MYSPDGRWWWNGTEWVPAPQWRTRYEITPWTRQLQVAVLALQAIGVVFAAFILPFIFNQSLTQQAALSGDPQTTEAVRQVFAGVLIFAAVFALVLVAVLVVGVLMLWRWLYWYLMLSYGFALLALPLNVVNALGYGTIQYPSWYFFIVFPLAVVQGALCVWMVIAYRRYGNWARRKIVEPA